MECHVDFDAVSNRVKVYLFRRDFVTGQAQWLVSEGRGTWCFEVVDEGGRIEPTFEFDTHTWEALASALSEVPLPDRAVSEHLKDAREVRDRLLAIVERP